MRSAIAARLVLGIACVAVPGRLLAVANGLDQEDARARGVARALGTRLLLQAGLDAVLGRRTRGVDMVVELTHAASMLPVALIWPPHRRSALMSAACATGIALLDVVYACSTDGAPQASRRLSRDINRSQR